MKYVFGPVPSRRLGLSLGVDLVLPKTCTMDCVYCELGPTTNRTVKRAAYVDADDVLRELKERLSDHPKVDFVTISGSGEPTLNVELGDIVRGIRALTTSPIAVLTNGSLMTEAAVRADLATADVVAPSVDAVSVGAFRKVNRPHPSLDPEDIVDGIARFSSEFDGEVWLEIVFVDGMNDDPAEIALLRGAIDRINPDRVQVNTVIRPPSEPDVRPVERSRLSLIASELGPCAEIISAPTDKTQTAAADVVELIVSMAARRPVTVADVATAIGTNRAEAAKTLDSLAKSGLLRLVRHGERLYYRA